MIMLCIIFFNSVYFTCAINGTANEKIEMVVTAKLSPSIESSYLFVQRFLIMNKLAYLE